MDKVVLMRAIVSARILQLYYHSCHNLISGESFFADHEFFGGVYPQLETHYDRLAEYYICLFGKKAFETKILTKAVSEELEKHEIEEMCCCDMFKLSQKLETKFYKELENISKKASIGLANMVGDIAEQSDVRMYKIQQRLEKEED